MACRNWHSRDLLLLLLQSPGATEREGELIRGRTRLTKLMYLFREEAYTAFKFNRILEPTALPGFEPWKFGPFSRDVFIDLDFLVQTGFVVSSADLPVDVSDAAASEFDYWMSELAIDVRDTPDEYYEECFMLTDRGRSFTRDRLLPHLSEVQISGLYQFKKRYAQLPLRVLLRYVYENYPGMTVKSEIVRDVLS